jgi:hypothetical protein
MSAAPATPGNTIAATPHRSVHMKRPALALIRFLAFH